jgi:NADH dehydrogenase FAD-containing subunit/nitrite reductase/ring-hydroxylating ferredoxin subunit
MKKLLSQLPVLRGRMRKGVFSLKQLTIPTFMMGVFGYQTYMNNKQTKFPNFSSKILKAAEETKGSKLYLDGWDLLEEGQMKPVKYGPKDEDTILIVNYKGKIHALGNHCPHFGAPLHTGVLIDKVVKCPWHGANIDILTGKTDLAPAIDDIPTYEIQKEEGTGNLYINLPSNVLKKIVPKMSKRDPNDKRRFVIIGGGPAGLSAAESLRQGGYTGEILILSSDKYVPYDRTSLSKFIPKVVDYVLLRSPAFLKEYGIDIQNDTTVSGIDNKGKKIQLEGGQEIQYDKLLIAAGGKPLNPKFKGQETNTVLTLRTYTDLEEINKAAANAKNIAIVGGSFIGMEAASLLKKAYKDSNITVIDLTATPFFQTLGHEVGNALQALHETNGVNFKLKSSLTEIQKDKILFEDGSSVNADLVIVGIGITPNSSFLQEGKQLAMDRTFVKTDKYLRTSDENIFAAGDIASVPYFQNGEQVYNINKFRLHSVIMFQLNNRELLLL